MGPINESELLEHDSLATTVNVIEVNFNVHPLCYREMAF